MSATAARLGSRVRAPQTTSKQRLRLWLRLLRAARAIEGALRERLRTTFMMTLPQFDVMAALARTRTGADRFAEMAAAHEAWVDELLSDFTKADTEVLIAHLDGLAGRIRKGERRP